MLLSDRSGICCDICGMKCHQDFDYYSFDFREISLIYGRKPSLEQITRMKPVSSLDVCGNCFFKISEQIVKINKTPSKKTRCDISGEVLTDTFYYCIVSKVKVKMSNMPNICNNCKTPTHDIHNCPKCGGKKFTKVADMKVDNRYVDIIASKAVYTKMIADSDKHRSNSNQWTTES